MGAIENCGAFFTVWGCLPQNEAFSKEPRPHGLPLLKVQTHQRKLAYSAANGRN